MKFTTNQVEELRTRYNAIERVDPCGAAYAGICKLLDATSQEDLKMLADAGIKWISRLARNRCK